MGPPDTAPPWEADQPASSPPFIGNPAGVIDAHQLFGPKPAFRTNRYFQSSGAAASLGPFGGCAPCVPSETTCNNSPYQRQDGTHDFNAVPARTLKISSDCNARSDGRVVVARERQQPRA